MTSLLLALSVFGHEPAATPQAVIVPMYQPVYYAADDCAVEAVEVRVKVKRRPFARRRVRARAVSYGYYAPRGGLTFSGPLYGGCD